MKDLSISTFQNYNMLQDNVNTDERQYICALSDNEDFMDNDGDIAQMSEGGTIDMTPEEAKTIDNDDAKALILQMGEHDEATGCQITQTSVERGYEIVTKGHQLIGIADMEQSAKDMISSVFGNADGENGSIDRR